MKSPVILQGESFDWEQGNDAMLHVINDDGSINWWAAFGADPGVVKCPGCGVHLWREGQQVECPDCHETFSIDTSH